MTLQVAPRTLRERSLGLLRRFLLSLLLPLPVMSFLFLAFLLIFFKPLLFLLQVVYFFA